MHKKIIALMILLVISYVFFIGCITNNEADFEPKTSEDYKIEAENQITEENLDSELEKLEKEIAEEEAELEEL